MKRWKRLQKALAVMAATVLLAAGQASAGVIALFDFGINIDGTTTCSSSGCDNSFAADLSGAGVEDSGFDYDTGLGTLSLTITGVGAHAVDLFVDHDIDEATNTYFNEYGSGSGVLAPGQTAEIDEPGFSFGDIFDNFLDGTLDNTSAIAPGSEDDVSMALGWDFLLAAGETAAIDFLLSTTQPAAGFYLLQTDPESGAPNQIYFSSVLEIRAVAVDEPATLALLGLGLLGLGMARRRRAA